MRPITVSVGPLAATSNVGGGQAVGLVGCFTLNFTPVGGTSVSAFVGNCTITNGVLTVNSTTSGAFGAGARLTGPGVAPGSVVVGPGPTPGTWRVYPTQTLAATGGIRLNQVQTLDAPRQITITNTEPAGANSFTVSGTDAAGNPISETLVSTGAAVTTSQNFATVTQISCSAPLAATATPVTAATASSQLVMFDPWAQGPITKQASLAGAATFSVQISNDDPNAPGGPLPGSMTWSNDPDATFVGATTPVEGSWAFVPLFARVLLTAGAGAVRMTFLQAGGPYL
jgi:hypothetical protein